MGCISSFLSVTTGVGVPLALVTASLLPQPARPEAPAALAANFGQQESEASLDDDLDNIDRDAAVSVLRRSDGLFHVPATVNGYRLRFIVDTGASVVVLSESDARAAGLDVDGAAFNGNMATVGGTGHAAWVRLDELAIAGHRLRDIDVAVVKEAQTSLLGQNVLSQLSGVQQSGDRITLR